MLSGVQFILNEEDTRVCEADSQGRFTVNTCSKLIDRVVYPGSVMFSKDRCFHLDPATK
jgi:hypothetical protein